MTGAVLREKMRSAGPLGYLRGSCCHFVALARVAGRGEDFPSPVHVGAEGVIRYVG